MAIRVLIVIQVDFVFYIQINYFVLYSIFDLNNLTQTNIFHYIFKRLLKVWWFLLKVIRFSVYKCMFMSSI